MLGTKCPSITSRCSTSAPAATTARTSSPSFAKSLDRIDGRIFNGCMVASRNGGTPGRASKSYRVVTSKVEVAEA